MAVLVEIGNRYANLCTLQIPDTADQGTLTAAFTLPAGYGDVLILEGRIDIGNIATQISTAPLVTPGFRAFIADSFASGLEVDLLDSGKLFYQSTSYVGSIKPDQPTLLKQSEAIYIQVPDVDIHVTPTQRVTLTVHVECLRTSRGAF